jgi:hypothetical protein
VLGAKDGSLAFPLPFCCRRHSFKTRVNDTKVIDWFLEGRVKCASRAANYSPISCNNQDTWQLLIGVLTLSLTRKLYSVLSNHLPMCASIIGSL